MDILFLGTGAGIPSKTRNVTSLCLRLLQERRSVWMFDCGEGTQQQLLHFPVKMRQLEALFVTHLHGDHAFGIPGLLTTRASQGADSPLTLYGPKGLRRFVETVLEISVSHLTYDISVEEIDSPGAVVRLPDFTVEADFLEHNIPSLGFRITEQPRPGQLLANHLEELGVPKGPAYGRLKSGHPVTLENGRVIQPDEVLKSPLPGRIVTILGDTRPTPAAVRLAADASLLVHEATFAADAAPLAAGYGHSTAAEAARIALEAGAHKLALTHISQRYSDSQTSPLLNEALAIFPNTVVAHDGLVIDIPINS